MDRIINMILRRLARQIIRSGLKGAAQTGARAFSRRAARRDPAAGEQIDQDPSVTYRRRRHPDERKGDEILYPTDDYTEGMQPRR